MKFRHLGNSGLKISEITYGNWLTHGSQLENDTATQCVRAALDAGISTFDTADMYANTAAETVLGDALAGRAPRVARDLHEGLLPDRPEGAQRHRPLAQAHHRVDRRLAPPAKTDYVDLYQAHRYDYETPLEETMLAFADIVRAGKALYIGVSEWNAEQLRAGPALAKSSASSSSRTSRSTRCSGG